MDQVQQILELSNLQYERRKPEETVLYQVVQKHYRDAIEGNTCKKQFPFFIKKEFESYLKCGILSEGFVRIHCPHCDNNRLLAFSCKQRGICPSCGARRMHDTADYIINNIIPFVRVRQWVISFPFHIRYLMAYDCEKLNKILSIVIRAINSFYRKKAKANGVRNAKNGAIVFIQRFGSMNLNVHFHILFADGSFHKSCNDKITFTHVKRPTTVEVEEVNRLINKRVITYLKKIGMVQEYEEGNVQFENLPSDDGVNQIYQHSIMRKVASGKRKGRRVEKIGAVQLVGWTPPIGERNSYLDGFSLHANVDIPANDRSKLENLIKYTARPALANSRISKDLDDHILYELKNKYTDGTTHLRFSPEEFIEKLIALIPPPRKNLIRYFGVFAPNHKERETITNIIKRKPTLVKEIKESSKEMILAEESFMETISLKPRYWIPWAELLKKTFNIDALKCEKCSHQMKVVNYVCNQNEIAKILKNLELETIVANICSTGPPLNSYQYELEPGDWYQEEG